MYSVAQIGRQRLAAINSASAKSRLAYYAAHNVPANATPDTAWQDDEIEAAWDRAFISIAGSDERWLKAFEPQIVRVHNIEEFDRERRDAFNVELSPPYVKDTFTINAVDMANLCPFVMITLLTLLLALRIRQRAYELALASTFLGGRPSPSERAKLHALAEFRVGTLRMRESLKGQVWVYKKPFTAFAETLIMLVVVALVAWYSGKLLPLSDAAMEATHSVFLNFYGYMFTAFLAALAISGKTSSYYTNYTRSILGAPVMGCVSYRVTRLIASALSMAPGGTRISKTFRGSLVAFVGIISLVCLAFPWMTSSLSGGREFYGFDFLRLHPPFSRSASLLKSVEGFHALDPQIFSEFRAILVVSVLFVVFSTAASRNWLRRKDRTLDLQKTRRLFSYLLLMLAGYVMCYLLALNFLQSKSSLAQANVVVGMMFEGTKTRVAKGLPLLAYNPCPAFWVFFASCVLLAAVGITAGNHRRTLVTGEDGH
jgi:hypothetical protein